MINLRDNKLLMGLTIGIFSSYVANFLFSFSPDFLRFLAKYSFGLLTSFVDTKIKQAATLESINYSFYILIILYMLFVTFCMILFYLKKKSKNKQKKIEPEIIKKNENNRAIKIFSVVYFIIIIIFLLFGLFFIMGESMVLNDITAFKHNLRILTPYMTIAEKEMIISEWSQMESFDDYKAIYNKLLEIANNQNIKLKFNRFY